MDSKENLLKKFKNRFGNKTNGKMRPVDPEVVFSWFEINVLPPSEKVEERPKRKKREPKIKLSDYSRSIV